jgi:hypothetical protein
MKKIVLVCGLVSGAIVSLSMAVTIGMYHDDPGFRGSMLLGYATMVLAFSLIFVGVKNYRDKHADGVISFGKALKIGLLISLIGSTMYVLTWMVMYYNFMPDFLDRYMSAEIHHMEVAGQSQEKIEAARTQFLEYKEMYKNPLFVFLFTYLEILPVGILVSLIVAAFMRRSAAKTSVPV